MTQIISIINQKGGVGKTTTAINLAYCLSLEKKSVLLIDFDPQGNSTVGIGIEPDSFEYATHDVLLNKIKIDDVIFKRFEYLDVLPSNILLDNCEQLLSPQLFKEARLKKAIENLSYDYIIIDCRPSLGTLTINALFACNFIIVPCEMSKYSLKGLEDLLLTVKNVKDGDFDIFQSRIKILLTKYDSRNSITNEWVLDQLSDVESMILKTRIRQNEAINQSHISQEPVNLFNRSCNGAIDFTELTKEILTYE